MSVGYKDFWYIIAESHELTSTTVLSSQLLDEQLVCFRDENQQPVVFRDRCLHRCGRLSSGTVKNGHLQCPYHGWIYDKEGAVISIPSLVGEIKNNLKAISFSSKEQDGYIYVCLSHKKTEFQPFKMQYYLKPGWKTVRLKNLFHNNLANCVENFIDIPHTAFVHKGIFRSSQNEVISAKIAQYNGQVHVAYDNEVKNLGSFNWFLNPRRKPIKHTDSFFMPNITFVRYTLEAQWEYVITSQSIPVSSDKTLVYTDISYHFGKWTPWLTWIIKRQAQKVIDQDVIVLQQQMEVIKKYGQHLYDTPADKIHELVSNIHQLLEANQDPRQLPNQELEVKFSV